MINRLRHRMQGDRGASLVEFVLVAPLLIALLLGTAEMGLAIRDWLTITSASRAGARVGSAAAADEAADVAILAAVENAMSTSDFSSVREVWVYAVDPLTGARDPGRTNVYERIDGGCGWSPCPGGGVEWAPQDRNVTLGSQDTLGVRVEFNHQWITGFANLVGLGDAVWVDDAVMRLEPQEF